MKVLGEFVRRRGGIERRFTGSERRMLTNLAGGVIAAMESAAFETSDIALAYPRMRFGVKAVAESRRWRFHSSPSEVSRP